MKTINVLSRCITILAMFALLVSLSLPSDASAQRRRGFSGGGRIVHASPPSYERIYVGGHRYFYRGGYFYSAGRFGYRAVPAPIGARIRFLPFGFLCLNVGPIPYYYYGGIYYTYLPDENAYEVVQKPAGAPATTTASNQDRAVLTDGTAVTGVFQGADADTVQFDVNGQVRRIPITQITTINFAPSSFDSTSHK